MNFTIEDLKKNLGPGLGLRKSKYLLEIPSANSKQVNILCRSTSLPERTIGSVEVFDKGRKFKMRSETAFPNVYNISVVDDSENKLRRLFDRWLSEVDNTKPKNNGILGTLTPADVPVIDDESGVINNIPSASSNESIPEIQLGFLGYQTDINVWQLDNTGKKIYGYKLQNAFPTSVGTVELDDSDESTLSEFSVDFTYSEFIPIYNNL